MEAIWWKQITRASRFLTSISDNLLNQKSVILTLPRNLPWLYAMYEIAEDRLRTENPHKTVNRITCPKQSPGEYLLDSCEKMVRQKYRYGENCASFLAKQREITLNSKYIWVCDIPQERRKEWIDFVAEYRAQVPKNSEAANFVLECFDEKSWHKPMKEMKSLNYSDFVDDYDAFMFCALASTDRTINASLRPYQAELVSTICGKDIELCAACLAMGTDFLENPVNGMKEIAKSNKRSDNVSFDVELDGKKINQKIWTSQVKLLFPMLETYRSNFVQEYRSEIQQSLPMRTLYDDEITDPEDVELGMLIWMANNCRLNLTSDKLDELTLFRDARNKLAHIVAIDFNTIKKILSVVNTNDA